MTDLDHEIFHLYANLLMEEACQSWDVIAKEQTELSLYTNICGVDGRSHQVR